MTYLNGSELLYIRCPPRLCGRSRPLQLCHWSSAVPTEDCCWSLTWHWSSQLVSHRHGQRRWHFYALFSPSSEVLSSVLHILTKEASKVGMSISWTKTKANLLNEHCIENQNTFQKRLVGLYHCVAAQTQRVAHPSPSTVGNAVTFIQIQAENSKASIANCNLFYGD